MTRAPDITRVARLLLEEEGRESLTMRRLADRLGIRAASLYKHLRGKEALESMVVATGLDELKEVLSTADRQLVAVVRAYRSFALAHPHLFGAMAEHPDRLLEGVLALFDREQPARARAAWALAHGLVQLELAARPPVDEIEAAWEAGLAALATGSMSPVRAVVRSWSGPD